MARKQRLVIWMFLCVIVLGIAPLAFAQSGLPQTGGDTGGGFGGAGPSDIVNHYWQGTTAWMDAIKPIATNLFWALAGIDLTWTCITLVLQHSELQPWMAGFLRKILTIGFFATLLINGPAWVSSIVNFFIGLGGTAGGISPSNLSASGIMGSGIQIAGRMLAKAVSAGGTGIQTSPIGLLVSGVSSLAPTIILALGSLLIIACYVLIALHFVIAMVEAYVVVGAGYIFLGFGGSRWTVPYTEKYVGMVVSAGVRIMVLELMIGLGGSLANSWGQTAMQISQIPDILDGGTVTGGWTGVQLLFALVSSIAIYALLCWTIPQIAANVVGGGLSMSGGDVLVAAGAGATAAAAVTAMGSSTNSQTTQSDLMQIAQAAAMKGAEMGVQAGLMAVTSGATAPLETAAVTENVDPPDLKGGTKQTDPEPPTDNTQTGGPHESTPPIDTTSTGGQQEASGPTQAQGELSPGTDAVADAHSQGTSSESEAPAETAEQATEHGSAEGPATAQAEAGQRAPAELAGESSTSRQGDSTTTTESAEQASAEGAAAALAEAEHDAFAGATEGSNQNGSRAAVEGAQLSAEQDTEKAVESVVAAEKQTAQAAVGTEKSEAPAGSPAGPGTVQQSSTTGLAEKAHRGLRDLQGALSQMPEDGGNIQGTTPDVSHGE